MIREERPNIVVGTPGRTLDLVQRGELRIGSVKRFITLCGKIGQVFRRGATLKNMSNYFVIFEVSVIIVFDWIVSASRTRVLKRGKGDRRKLRNKHRFSKIELDLLVARTIPFIVTTAEGSCLSHHSFPEIPR